MAIEEIYISTPETAKSERKIKAKKIEYEIKRNSKIYIFSLLKIEEQDLKKEKS